MPSKKGQRQAARQTQLSGRYRHRAGPRLTEAQLRGPAADAEAGSPDATSPSELNEEARAELTTTIAAAPQPPPAMTLRARRERQAIALQAGPSLRSEVLRIGIVGAVIVAVLAGLKFGSDFGA